MSQLTVADLMTEQVFSVNETDDLATVSDLMDGIGIRHIPVINEEGELIGLVSQRDILRSGLFADDALTLEQRQELLRKTKAGEIMVRDVATIGPDDSLEEAAITLLENKFGCLPVVEGAHLLGILTKADFVRFVLRLIQSEEEDTGVSEAS